ncbi:MAG: 3-phenylpropionate MFS transporter [Plesiomonas sp.]
MTLSSPLWLGVYFFTYFLTYGIYLPFWSLWLSGTGQSAENIGLLLGVGLTARFIGNLFITPRVKHAGLLIHALRLLGGLSLVSAAGFLVGQQYVGWLFIIMVLFNLMNGPLIPLGDALANTWQRQIGLDYGRARLWGSFAFITGSTLVGWLISYTDYHAALWGLLVGLVVMNLCWWQTPATLPAEKVTKQQQSVSFTDVLRSSDVVKFLLCVTLLQGSHAAYYAFSTLYWQELGYSTTIISMLWSVGVIAEIAVFAFSGRFFDSWSIRRILLLCAVCVFVRWGLLAEVEILPGLIVIQLMHGMTFALCHVASIRFIREQPESHTIRLQAIYAALVTGGGIAVMTVVSGYLYTYLGSNVFWCMALLAIPAILLSPSRTTA